MLPYTAHDLINAVSQDLVRTEPAPERQPAPSQPQSAWPADRLPAVARELAPSPRLADADCLTFQAPTGARSCMDHYMVSVMRFAAP